MYKLFSHKWWNHWMIYVTVDFKQGQMCKWHNYIHGLLSFAGKLVPALENTVALASVLTITAISTERYYAICQPLRVQYFCTGRRTFAIIVTIWIIAMITCLPFYTITIFKDSMQVDGTPIKACRTYIIYHWQKVFIFVLTFICFVIPMFILIAVYGVISRQLYGNENQNIARDVNNANWKAHKQVIVMLFSVIMLFFICMLPLEVIRLWSIFAGPKDLERLGFEGYLGVVYSGRVMFYLNSAINPICYNIMSTKFRMAFRRALCRKRGPLMRTQSVGNSSYYCSRFQETPTRMDRLSEHRESVKVNIPLIKIGACWK